MILRNRHSIRLRGYDYSKNGFYFVTICTQNRNCIFGDVLGEKNILNAVGEMVNRWCVELDNKFPEMIVDDYVIMPNHMHAIMTINNNKSVGADLCVCPKINQYDIELGEHIGSPLHRMIQWFKTMTTNEYIRNVKQNNWPKFDHRLWQRNYWEHIIRNEEEYYAINQYIKHNPNNWENDKLHIK